MSDKLRVRASKAKSHCLAVDFPVNHSVQPGSEQAQAMTATSGRRCYEWLLDSHRLTLWQKTFLDCFLSTGVWYSRLCALTWSVQDTKFSRSIIRLRASVPRTDETECSLWPTPVANDDNKTPAAHRAMKGRMGGNRTAITSLQVMAKHVEQSTGSLNPTWVEWLMGFPIGWTDCEHSETP